MFSKSIAALSIALIVGCGAAEPNAEVDPAALPLVYNPANPNGLGPAPVWLGATNDMQKSGGYVLLAKTGISNVTGSSISGGHVGISPAPFSSIAGFALVADSTEEFATSAAVTAPYRVYASDYSGTTSTNLSKSVDSMEAAYEDAARRTTPDHLDLAEGNLGGQTLSPGLYTWNGSVSIPSDVTISGGPTDVWIFQIANDLDQTAGTSILLTGDANPANIFWQVGGEVLIHENANFKGVILSRTDVTLRTSATLVGRIHAQSSIVLDNNHINP